MIKRKELDVKKAISDYLKMRIKIADRLKNYCWKTCSVRVSMRDEESRRFADEILSEILCAVKKQSSKEVIK